MFTRVCVQMVRRLEKARKKAEAIGNSDTSEKEKVQQMKQCVLFPSLFAFICFRGRLFSGGGGGGGGVQYRVYNCGHCCSPASILQLGRRLPVSLQTACVKWVCNCSECCKTYRPLFRLQFFFFKAGNLVFYTQLVEGGGGGGFSLLTRGECEGGKRITSPVTEHLIRGQAWSCATVVGPRPPVLKNSTKLKWVFFWQNTGAVPPDSSHAYQYLCISCNPFNFCRGSVLDGISATGAPPTPHVAFEAVLYVRSCEWCACATTEPFSMQGEKKKITLQFICPRFYCVQHLQESWAAGPEEARDNVRCGQERHWEEGSQTPGGQRTIQSGGPPHEERPAVTESLGQKTERPKDWKERAAGRQRQTSTEFQKEGEQVGVSSFRLGVTVQAWQ